MGEIKYGRVSVEIGFELPARSGELTPKEVMDVVRAPRGIGLVCDDVADALVKHPRVALAADVEPEQLRKAGRDAEEIDRVIVEVEAVLSRLKQGNLLLDSAAYEMLRRVNDQVKALGKNDEGIRDAFAALVTILSRKKREAGATPE